MTDEHWTPPPRRKGQLSLAALGVPPGRYVMPDPSEFWYSEGGHQEGAQRLERHLYGDLPLDQLEPAEVDFLRNHFLTAVEEQRQRAIAHFEAKVPRRYVSAKPDPIATAWATAAANNPLEVRSLFIVGPTGTGKTHFAYAVLRAFAETGTSAKWSAYTAADLYARLRPRSGRDSEAEFETFAGADVLFVDDLGAAKLSEWTEEVTYRLINHRYEQCLPGIFTSNVPPAQLRDVLGERIASRLTEMCERVVLKGDDRRKGMAA